MARAEAGTGKFSGVGRRSDGPGGTPIEWQNANGVIGLTINSSFNPDNKIPQTVSKAAYLVIADQGTWVRTEAASGKQSDVQEHCGDEGGGASDAT